MSKRLKIILIVIFVFIDGCLLTIYYSLKDNTLHNNLIDEVGVLSKLSIGKDRFNTKIRSRGSYAVCEKAIKEYLDNNAVLLQDTFKILKDDRLTGILSYDNYTKDGPLFTESLKYLSDSKKDFNEKVKSFNDNLSEDKMISYIEEVTNDSHARELYKELILTPELKKKYEDTKKMVDDASTKVNNVLDISTTVLNFLVQNNGNWVVQDGQIKFKSQSLYDQYIAGVNQLNNNQS